MSVIVQIKNELKKLGIRPKKSLGQNFLINEGVYRKIVTALEVRSTDTILEIGPGLGTLTEYLAATGAYIVAVEKDWKLAEYLKQKFATSKNVTITEDDILKFDPFHWKLGIGNWKLVGNIPYYLTSRLLRNIFEDWPRPGLVVLTIQKEVAQRICAKPPNMSLLAVSVQYYAEPKIISYVSHGSFYPPPEVDSALIKLEPRPQTDAEPYADLRGKKGKAEKFFKIVKTGFAGKRKQLANNLARELGILKSKVEEKLKSAGVDPKRRAETLTINEWQKVTKIFYGRG